jgi:hypothetical protein
MSAPQRIVLGGTNPEPRGGPKPLSPPLVDTGWSLLGVVGLAFAALGALDQSLGWLPPHFGNPEWEFGTITHMLDGLPITVLGLVMVLASAAQRRVGWAVRVGAAACWTLAALIAVAFVVFLLDVPVALRAVTQPALKAGLVRAIAKAIAQGLLYPTVLVAIGVQGVRATRRARG